MTLNKCRQKQFPFSLKCQRVKWSPCTIVAPIAWAVPLETLFLSAKPCLGHISITAGPIFAMKKRNKVNFWALVGSQMCSSLIVLLWTKTRGPIFLPGSYLRLMVMIYIKQNPHDSPSTQDWHWFVRITLDHKILSRTYQRLTSGSIFIIHKPH